MKQLSVILLLAATLVGCDAIDAIHATKEMNGKMDEMNESTEKLAEGVHLQSLVIPINELLKSDSFLKLSPFPTTIVLYAKPFAEEARPKELVELTYLWLKEIDEVATEPDLDHEGKPLPDGINCLGSCLDRLNQMRREKIGKLMTLQAVAGFTPQNTVESLIRSEIYGDGRYYEAAMKFLMLRYVFIRDILLDNSLLNQNLDKIGEIEEAVSYMKRLDYLARLPFADQIALVTRGVIKPYLNAEYALDAETRSQLGTRWKLLKLKAQSEMKFEKRSLTGDAGNDQRILDESRRKMGRALQTIESHIRFWKGQR